MPVVGVLLGLALASKWVAAYAIGALGILVLARSALGRLLLIVAMIGLTGVLGYMAMAVPEGSTASGNLVFTLIMIGLTLAAVAITAYRPDRLVRRRGALRRRRPGRRRASCVVPGRDRPRQKAGSGRGGRADQGHAAAARVRARRRWAGSSYLAFNVAGRLGFGPMAPRPPRRATPAPARGPAAGRLAPAGRRPGPVGGLGGRSAWSSSRSSCT